MKYSQSKGASKISCEKAKIDKHNKSTLERFRVTTWVLGEYYQETYVTVPVFEVDQFKWKMNRNSSCKYKLMD